jgi:hypothetical protein
MAYDHSKRRRQLAAECLEWARRSKDQTLRVALLDRAQNWLEQASDPRKLDCVEKMLPDIRTPYHLASN